MKDSSIKQLTIPEDSSWDRKNLTYYFRQYCPWWLREFIRGIRNIIRWIPVIYRDRDWDHSYIFEILKFKLKNQRQYIVENNRHEGVDRDNRDITLCLNLIEKVQNDYYDLEYSDYHKSDYNWLPVEGSNELSELEIDQKSENFDDYFVKNKLWYKRAYKWVSENSHRYSKGDKAIEDKCIIAMKIGDLKHEKAKKLLFKILHDKIENWWD